MNKSAKFCCIGGKARTWTILRYTTPKKYSQIEQAFDELKRPTTDTLSCMHIAQAYIHDARSPLGQKADKSSLIRWLVVEALHTNPSLFGPHAQALQAYFDQLLTQETAKELQKRTQGDTVLSTMQQGDTFQDLKAFQAEMLSRLKAHKPFVISIIDAGYGDSMLLTPLIEDIATTLKLMGSKSTIRYIVKEGLAEVIGFISGFNDNVEVIPYNRQPGEMYALFLTQLAVVNRPSVQFDDEGKPFIPGYAEEAGIILGWERPGEEYTAQCFLEGAVFGRLKPFNSRILLLDGPDKVFANTSRRSLQRDLSDFFGVKIFESATRDDITQTSRGMETFLQAYVATKESTEVRATLEELNKKTGFENGYLCVISQGSKDVKRIPPGLADVIAGELADFCKEYRIGIVLIQTIARDDVNAAFCFTAHGIPTHRKFSRGLVSTGISNR